MKKPTDKINTEGGSGIDYAAWFAVNGDNPPKHIICRLSELSDEWDDLEKDREKSGDISGAIMAAACRERLHEVVSKYFDEMKTWEAAHKWAKEIPSANAEVSHGVRHERS